jgi:hypothetical protein
VRRDAERTQVDAGGRGEHGEAIRHRPEHSA